MAVVVMGDDVDGGMGEKGGGGIPVCVCVCKEGVGESLREDKVNVYVCVEW